jgi:hypothetical protein
VTPPQRVLGRLWSRQKQDVTLICVIVAAPTGEEVRILQGETVCHSEVCVDRTAALRRAEALRGQFEAHGWV